MGNGTGNNHNSGMIRSKFKVVIFILIPLIVALSCMFYYIYHKNENSYVIKINNEPISKKEFKQAMLQNTAQIYAYFNQKYGASESKEFWTNSYDGEVPIGIARKNALDKCVRVKMEQVLAKEKGLIQDISYSAFLKNLKAENIRRKEIAEKNGVLYGPVQYREEDYFSYVHSNMVIKLKEKLEEELAIKQEELVNYYETIKDKYYKKEDYLKVEKIILPYVDENGYGDPTLKENQKESIEQAKDRIDNGKKFENVAMDFNKDGVVFEQVFDETTAKIDSKINSLLKTAAAGLSVGQTSGIIEENNAYYIIKCIDRVNKGFKQFDEVKDNVQIHYVNEKYEELIDRLVKEAKIEIDTSIYDDIFVLARYIF